MKTTRSSKNRSKKQYQATEKLAIIREHLLGNKTISDLCDAQKIAKVDCLPLRFLEVVLPTKLTYGKCILAGPAAP